MPTQPVEDLFDLEHFRADVIAFKDRNEMSFFDLYTKAGYDWPHSHSWRFLQPGYHKAIPFRMILALADVCDLSLDIYRKGLP